MGIFDGITAFFNRAGDRRGGGVFLGAESNGENVVAKDPQGDPLVNLTAKRVENDLRRDINRGLFANPAWTFHELAAVSATLGDKVAFWKSKIGALEWSIRVDADAEKGRAKVGEDGKPTNPDAAKLAEKAEKQRQCLKDRYEKIKNLRKAIRHMATARFYGFAVLKNDGETLAPVDPWNVVHDVEWKGDTAPSYGWHFNRRAETQFKPATMPKMEIGEFIIRESDECNMVALMRLALRDTAVTDFREKNLEEASKNQIIILTGDKLPDQKTDPVAYQNMMAALKDARDGKSVVLAKGDPNCPTEVVKPDGAQGLPYYNETLDKIEQKMTKAVTGGLLTMLSMPQGIGSGASDNHADTLADILEDDAKGICESFWEAIDRPVLQAAGLLADGERQLAWFDLGLPGRKDSATAAQTLSTLKGAGYAVSDEQASDMLGFDVEAKDAEKEDPQANAKGSGGRITLPPSLSALMNRAKGAMDTKKAEAEFDAGFMAFLDELAKTTGDDIPDEEWRKKIIAAIEKADPSDLADSDALQKYLEEKILKGIRDGGVAD